MNNCIVFMVVHIGDVRLLIDETQMIIDPVLLCVCVCVCGVCVCSLRLNPSVTDSPSAKAFSPWDHVFICVSYI